MPKLKLHRIGRIKHAPGIALSILLLSLLTYLLGWSTLLAAKSVVIDGTLRKAEISSQILNPHTAFRIGIPLARVDVHSLSRRISQLDWVASEEVKREWLHGRIHIAIQERTPIAEFTNVDGARSFFDKTGSVFSAQGSNSYPLITFANVSPDLIKTAAGFIQNLSSDSSSNSSSNSSTDLLANMTSLAIRSTDFIESSHSGLASGKVIVRWGSNEEMVTKVKVLRALLALPENAHAKLFDLSSPLSPIVK